VLNSLAQGRHADWLHWRHLLSQVVGWCNLSGPFPLDRVPCVRLTTVHRGEKTTTRGQEQRKEPTASRYLGMPIARRLFGTSTGLALVSVAVKAVDYCESTLAEDCCWASWADLPCGGHLNRFGIPEPTHLQALSVPRCWISSSSDISSLHLPTICMPLPIQQLLDKISSLSCVAWKCMSMYIP